MCWSVVHCSAHSHVVEFLQASLNLSFDQTDVKHQHHLPAVGSYLQHCHEMQQQQQQQLALVKVQKVLHTSNVSTPDEAIPPPPPLHPPNQMSPRILRALLPPESLSFIEHLSTRQPQPCIPKPEKPSQVTVKDLIPGIDSNQLCPELATSALCQAAKKGSPLQASPESVLDLFQLSVNADSCQEHSCNITASTHNATLSRPILFDRPNLLKLDLTPKPVQPPVHTIAPPLTFGDVLVDIDLPVHSAQPRLDYMQAPQTGHTPLSNGNHPMPAVLLQPQRDYSPTPAAPSLTPEGPGSVFKRLGQTPPAMHQQADAHQSFRPHGTPHAASNGFDPPPGFATPGPLTAEPMSHDQDLPPGFPPVGSSPAHQHSQRSGMRSDQAPYSARSQDSAPRSASRAASSSSAPPPSNSGPPPGFAGLPAYLQQRLSPAPAQKPAGLPNQAAQNSRHEATTNSHHTGAGQEDSPDEPPPGFARAHSSALHSRASDELRDRGGLAGPKGTSAEPLMMCPQAMGPHHKQPPRGPLLAMVPSLPIGRPLQVAWLGAPVGMALSPTAAIMEMCRLVPHHTLCTKLLQASHAAPNSNWFVMHHKVLLLMACNSFST